MLSALEMLSVFDQHSVDQLGVVEEEVRHAVPFKGNDIAMLGDLLQASEWVSLELAATVEGELGELHASGSLSKTTGVQAHCNV
ncbi:MAG: hypothetical protein CUN49_10600 [Candidatus Thermofonsia Clade 1 bacterium]|uniref:Uncharacterized protein n=1 Tax=Candidatus Thermofonsia Clade 1 bacterium TaxID=2364210 RepID=A0A2M8PD02_9CHLR|nr:MAG: hypothetical protein CUN49_10600 [Candidatus Thermofonsia Clade 1 bacterium]